MVSVFSRSFSFFLEWRRVHRCKSLVHTMREEKNSHLIDKFVSVLFFCFYIFFFFFAVVVVVSFSSFSFQLISFVLSHNEKSQISLLYVPLSCCCRRCRCRLHNQPFDNIRFLSIQFCTILHMMRKCTRYKIVQRHSLPARQHPGDTYRSYI